MTKALLVLVRPRFIKKLEHSWKALVYDGVSRSDVTRRSFLNEPSFGFGHACVCVCALSCPARPPVLRTPSLCTGPGFTPVASSSSWARGSSWKTSVSLQFNHCYAHTHADTLFIACTGKRCHWRFVVIVLSFWPPPSHPEHFFFSCPLLSSPVCCCVNVRDTWSIMCRNVSFDSIVRLSNTFSPEIRDFVLVCA